MSTRDALVTALGQVIANERREWRRERELIQAEAWNTIAELRAENAAARVRLEELVRERLATLRDGQDGAPGKDGRDGADGAPGERGEPGPPGKLPTVREWLDTVHYEDAVVTHKGAVYQAQRDTGREPPHDDWLCIAPGGRDGEDGRSLNIRGTWSGTERYQRLDIVAVNGGGSFIALCDDPGPCPGEGWQLQASPGKRGPAGEPGRRGDRGQPGPALIGATLDDEGLMILTNADQTSVALDLYPVLSKIAH